jgi:hypothetical protein
VQSLDEVLRDENMSTEERWEAVALQFEIDKLLLRYVHDSLLYKATAVVQAALILALLPLGPALM